MNNTYYGKLIFELSQAGRVGYSLPKNAFSQHHLNELPAALRRTTETLLPEVDELTAVRHYTNMSNNNFGIETGFYPLGSCTMKYNPKINEEMAAHPRFTALHPAQDAATTQGALELYDEVQRALSEVSGLHRFTLNPYAGAHGEMVGLMIMRTYHLRRGDAHRTKIIVPNSSHGTNPASAAVCGLQIVEVKSTPDGTVDVQDLIPLLGDDVAGMMMTNPNTLGIFETQIPEIARLVHEAGGLMYYDGANLNPMLGACRPGDMGFDVMHINLHKTFSTPHGGGGPGAGPVGVREDLAELLPNPQVHRREDGTYEWFNNEKSIGYISNFLGNYGTLSRAYSYLLTMGRDRLKMVGPLSVINANYVKEKLKDCYELPTGGLCKHEFVFDGLKDKSTEVTTLDVAKRLLDHGYHAPTIYFPMLFHQSLMIEPTETESKETLDAFIEVMRTIAEEAATNPEIVKTAPHNTPVRRLDDVKAVREPKLTFKDLV